MESNEIIQSQLEIIQGYYNRIVMQKPDIETVILWLEDDLKTIRANNLVLCADNIINPVKDKFEVSKVKCDICNYSWVAVRPFGLEKLECPKCGNLSSFENDNN